MTALRDLNVNPDELQQRIEAFHARTAEPLDALLGVHLDADSDGRFNRFHDALLIVIEADELSANARRSFGLTYFVREGITEALYHQRNVARIEKAVLDICGAGHGDGAHGLPEGNSSFGARTLAYEYHAYLYAVRATFDYLANVAYKYFDVSDSDHFRGLSKALTKHAADRDGANDTIAVAKRGLVDFEDVFGANGHTPRDTIAHTRPVTAGAFRLEWQAEERPTLVLVGGGESLDDTGPRDTVRLAPLLAARLVAVEDYVFELFATLPEFATSAAAARPAVSPD